MILVWWFEAFCSVVDIIVNIIGAIFDLLPDMPAWINDSLETLGEWIAWLLSLLGPVGGDLAWLLSWIVNSMLVILPLAIVWNRWRRRKIQQTQLVTA